MAATDRRQHWLNVLFPDEVDFPGKVQGLIVPSGFTAERPPSPTDGTIRFNKTTNKLEVSISSGWEDVGGTGSGGVTDFTDLSDTPASYAGLGGQLLRINGAQTAVEFVDGTTLFMGTGGATLNPGANLVFTGGGQVLGLPPLPGPTGAASKEYVDSVASGLDPKESCRVGTLSNITLSGIQTIDTVAVGVGQRVLVKNQTTTSENGIYIVDTGPWTRAPDQDGTPAAEASGGNFTFVETGSQAGSGWVVVADGLVNVGVDPMVWTQFVGAGGGVTFPLLAPDGTFTAPSYSFSSDPDTGVYRSANNTIGFSAGNALRMSVSDTQVVSTVQFIGPDGASVTPTYSFTSSQTTGMYSPTPSSIALVVNNNENIVLTPSALTPSVPIRGVNGSVSAPAFSFNLAGSEDTGMYLAGANTIGFSANGINSLQVSSTELLLLGNGTTTPGSARFFEADDNGSNSIIIKAPDDLATSTTYTLPATGPFAGEFLTSTVGGVMSWAVPAAVISYPLNGPNGTKIAPTFTVGGTDKGMYSSDGTTLNFSSNFAGGNIALNQQNLTFNKFNGLENVDTSADVSIRNGATNVNTFFKIDGAATQTNRSVGIQLQKAANTWEISNRPLSSGLAFLYNGSAKFVVETDGTLNVAGTTNYELLVTDDDDIPNKKYVDDAVSGVSFPLLAPDGSAAAPSYSFSGDTDMGMFTSGSALQLSVGGSARLQLLSTQAFWLVSQNVSGGGSAAAPAYRMGDTDTGMFGSSGVVRFSSNNTETMQLYDSNISGLVPFRGVQGSAAAPGFSFNIGGGTDCGMYLIGLSTLAFSTDGLERLRIKDTTFGGVLSVEGTTNYETLVLADDDIPNKKYVDDAISGASFPLLAPDGTVGAPSYSFSGDTDSGIYRVGGGMIGFATNGNLQMTVGLSSVDFTTPARSTIIGSATTPRFSFVGDTNTGMYSAGADQCTLVAGGGGGGFINITTSNTEFNNHLEGPAGTVSAPTYAFSVAGGEDDGLYRPASNAVGLTANGILRLMVGAPGTRVFGPTTTTGGSVEYMEGTANGSLRVILKAPDAITTTRTWTLPTDDPTVAAGNFLTTDASGNLSFAAAGGGVSFPLQSTTLGTMVGPAYSFSADQNTGMYSPGADQIALSVANSQSLVLSTTQLTPSVPIRGINGTAAAPSYSFDLAGSDDMGMYLAGSTTLGFSVDGTQRMAISTTAITPSLPIRSADGTSSDPTYSFLSDDDNGMYLIAANTLGFSTNSIERLRIEVNGTLSVQGTTNYETLVTDDDDIPNKKYVDDNAGASFPLLAPDGTNGAPSYSFASDTDTGITRTAGSLNFVIDASTECQMQAARLLYNGKIETNIVGSTTNIDYGFAAGGNDGMYQPSNGDVSFAINSQQRIQILAGSTTFFGEFANAAEVRFGEATTNGTNYVSLTAPDNVVSNQEWILPDTGQTTSRMMGIDLGEFTVAGLPTPSTYPSCWALATDAVGGRTIVRSDGTNWKIVVVEGGTVV